MDRPKKSNVTYGQLEAALRTLGFHVSAGKNSLGFPAVRFHNAKEDTVILLRGGSEDELLNAADLLSIERTVEGRGVADVETFFKLLQEASQKEAQAV